MVKEDKREWPGLIIANFFSKNAEGHSLNTAASILFLFGKIISTSRCVCCLQKKEAWKEWKKIALEVAQLGKPHHYCVKEVNVGGKSLVALFEVS